MAAEASTRLSMETINKHLELLKAQQMGAMRAVSVKQAALDEVNKEICKYEDIKSQKLAKQNRH